MLSVFLMDIYTVPIKREVFQKKCEFLLKPALYIAQCTEENCCICVLIFLIFGLIYRYIIIPNVYVHYKMDRTEFL